MAIVVKVVLCVFMSEQFNMKHSTLLLRNRKQFLEE